ncbi:hypothetical protein ABZ990_10365 [Streptomyces sp. NPDC046203]|uniref:hypothetical protein n=1 Tax=Streptomyces sp. NPDC046203 TaxID=3154602 RepID=UPI0033CBCF11
MYLVDDRERADERRKGLRLTVGYFSAIVIIAAISGCSLISPGEMPAKDQARLEYCAGLGVQMMTMMRIGSGDTENLDPARVVEMSNATVAAAEKVEGIDPDASTALAEDTSIAFMQSNDVAVAGPALTRATDYCESHGLDPMGSPSR